MMSAVSAASSSQVFGILRCVERCWPSTGKRTAPKRLLGNDAVDARATNGGAQKFPEAASFRISFSSVRTETARRSRAFSASRSFSRLTWSPLRPPYSCRQR